MESNIPIGQATARRRFLAAGSILSLFALLGLWRKARKTPVIDCGPEKSKETVRLLGQDGLLVEVDAARIRMLKKKITNDELQRWVRNKPGGQ
jgi:hypothetical protein